MVDTHSIKGNRELVGWGLDYHQIDPGRLRVFVSTKKVGDIRVMIQQVSLKIEALGTATQDHITVISPDTGQTVWANGFRLEDSDALLLRPDVKLHLVGGPTIVVLAHIPFSLLRKVGMSDGHIQSLDNRDGALLVSTAASRAESLRRLMSSSMHSNGRSVDQEARLARSAGNVILQAIEQQRHKSVSRSESWRTINRACEFIESNLYYPIRMKQVSDYAAASVSKLERTFRRELSLTPSRYILTRRLHAVNRELASTNSSNVKVSDLAMQYGFRHLGRFSASYRSHFGELPSQTLQAEAR